METTPSGIVYPSQDGSDTINVPLHMKYLAESVEARLPHYVDELPDSPSDGDEIYYEADDANGVIWHLRYRAAASGSYKWEFVGGSDLQAINLFADSAPNPGPAQMANPTLTLPLAGDWDISWGGRLEVASPSGAMTFVEMRINGTASGDDRVVLSDNAGAGNTLAAHRRKTASASGAVLTLWAGAAGANGNVDDKWMRARPVRVG